MKELDVGVMQCAGRVFKKLYKNMYIGARLAGEVLSEQEALSTITAAAWICYNENPDIPTNELDNQVSKLLKSGFCDHLSMAKEHSRLNKPSKKAAIAQQEWGVFPAKSPDPNGRRNFVNEGAVHFVDLSENSNKLVYDKIVSDLNISEVLQSLVKEINNVEACLAWILTRGFGLSIPKVLSILGMNKTGPKYKSEKKRVWSMLKIIDVLAKDIFKDTYNQLEQITADKSL